MARSTVKDMTEGNPLRLVLGFAIPLLFGFAFQQLYSFVDTAIVGKTLGADMLAAVGATGSVNFLILGLCNGLCAGMAIPVAQAFGAKDETELRRNVANAAYVCVAVSLFLGSLTAALTPQIMQLLNTDAAIIDHSVAYIRIIFAAIPITMLYNMSGGILRSLGDSKTPVTFLAVASLVNIALDFLFILGFGMGVDGAALATVISQLVSGVGCLIVMARRFPILHLTREDRRLRLPYCKRLVLIGIPMGLQYSITAIGSVLITWSVNGISVAAVAAMTAASKISMFFCCVFDALSTTMATFAGQNIGARKVERVGQGLLAATKIGVVYCIGALLVIIFFGRQMMGLFLDAATEGEVITMAHHFIIMNGIFYIPLLFVNIVRLTIQGMGYTSIAMIAGVCEMVARAAVAIFLVPVLGFDGACWANPAAWVAADLFLFPCYFRLIRQVRMRFANNR